MIQSSDCKFKMVNQPVRDPDLNGEITDTLKATQSLQEKQNRKETYQFKMKDRNIYKNGSLDEDTNNFESYGGFLRNKSTVTIGSGIRSCWVYILSLISLCTYTQSMLSATFNNRDGTTILSMYKPVMEMNIIIDGKVGVLTFVTDASNQMSIGGTYFNTATDAQFASMSTDNKNIYWADSYPGFNKIIVATSAGVEVVTVNSPATEDLPMTFTFVAPTLGERTYRVSYISPSSGQTTPSQLLALTVNNLHKLDLASPGQPRNTYTWRTADTWPTLGPLLAIKDSNVLLVNSISLGVTWHSLTDLSKQATISLPAYDGVQLVDFISDNLAGENYFYALYSNAFMAGQTSSKGKIVKHTVGSLVLTPYFSMDPHNNLHSIRNFGTLRYLMGIEPQRALIFPKDSFVDGTFAILTMIGKSAVTIYNPVSLNDKAYMGYMISQVIDGITKNTLISTEITLQSCTPYQDVTGGPIITCSKGCFLNQELTQCMDSSSLATNYGVTTKNYIVVECATGCSACSHYDNTICSVCSDGYFLVSTTCYKMDGGLPTGWGKKVYTDTNGIVITTAEVCFPSLNCATCTNNYKSCETCKPNYALYTPDGQTDKVCLYNLEDDAVNKGKGKDIQQSTTAMMEILVNCEQSRQCKTCLANYQDCTSCDYTQGLYLFTESNNLHSCKTASGGRGKEINSLSGIIVVKECDPAKNCLTCDADYSKCTTCDTSASATYKWLRSSDSSCVSTPDLGYTLQSTPDYKMVQCTALRCKTCLPTDLTRCTECLTATSLIRVDDGSCYETSPTWPAALAGYGRDTAVTPNTIVKCDSTLNCLACTASYKSCESCATNYGLYTSASTGVKSCVYAKEDDAVNTGKGKDTTVTSSVVLKDCDSTKQCLTCLADYTKCSSCDASQNLYLYTDNSCITPRDGVGPISDSKTGLITYKDCDPTKNCLSCSNSWSICSKCPLSYPYLQSSGACVASIPTGFFADSNNNLLQCHVSCATCSSSNSLQCLSCKTATSYIKKDDNLCYETNPWPASLIGYGLDTSANPIALTKCDSTLNCLSCNLNYKSCDSCPINYGLFIAVSTGIKSCIYSKEDDQINTGKGKDTAASTDTTLILVACDPTLNCLTCLPDSKSCTSCDYTANRYLYTTVSTGKKSCLTPGGGKGKSYDTTSGQITLKDCDSTKHCLTCDADYSKCTTCDTASVYKLLRTTDNSCTDALTQDGYVYNPDTNALVQCTALNCKTCSLSNLARCTSCLTDTSYIRTDDGNCYETNPWPAIINGYGKDNSETPPVLVQCQAALNCRTCNSNYQSCEICPSNYGIYTDSNNIKHCYYSLADDQFNKGKGIDNTQTTISTLKDCDPLKNCLTCLKDYTTCSSCDASKNLYLYTDSSTSMSSCLSPGSGKGKYTDPTTGLITLRDCDSTKHCLTCDADYSKCTTCDTSASATYKWLRSSDSSCVSTPDLGYTLQSTPDYKMVQCTALRCKTCLPTDLTRCTECLTATSLIRVDDGSCYETSPTWPAALAGYGRDTAVTPNTIVKCDSTLNCLACTASYKSCESCATNYGLYTSASTGVKSCVYAKEDDAVNTGKGKDTTVTSSVVLKDCDSTKQCLTCLADYTKCSSCDASQNLYLYTDNSCINPRDGVGKSKDATTGLFTLKDCDPTKHCKTCPDDWSKCSTCDQTTTYKYLRVSDYSCQLSADSGSVVTPSGTIVACLYPSTCKTCDPANIAKCLSCVSSTAYVKLEDNLCYETSPWPTSLNGFGKLTNTDGTYLSRCDLALNCLTCNNNYKSCESCSSDYSLYTDTSSGLKRCIYSKENDAVNKGKGKDTSSPGTMKDCQLGNCDTCLPDYTKCASCDASQNLYLYTDGRCLSPGSGKGKYTDPTTGLITLRDCDSTKHCLTCDADYSKCTTCDTSATATYKWLRSSDSSCVSTPDLGYTLQSTPDYKMVQCTALRCKTCLPTDLTRCTECLTATSLIRVDDGSCYETSPTWPAALAGYGRDTAVTPNTIVKCDSTLNCLACTASYKSCESCATNYGLYTSASTGVKSCVYAKEDDAVNTGKGKDLTQSINGAIVLNDCDSTKNCYQCLADYTTCSSCDASKNLYLYTDSSTSKSSCLSPGSGKGKYTDPTTGLITLRDCDSTKHCLTCDADYSKCTTCDTSATATYKWLRSSDSSCVSTPDLGYTLQSTPDYKMVQCTALRCQTCLPTDLTRCTECLTATSLIRVDDGSCYETSPTWPAALAGYGRDTAVTPNTIVKCDSTLNCLACTASYKSCESCATNYGLYTSASTGVKSCVYAKEDDAVNTGKGKDTTGTSSVVLKDCDSTKKCLTCLADYTKCSSCDASQNLYLYKANSACLSPGGQYGKVRDTTTGLITLDLCDSTKHCLTCPDDNTKCTTCDQTTQYKYLDTSTYVCATQDPGTLPTNCRASNCLTCDPTTRAKCTSCLTATSYIKVDDGSCYETSPWPTNLNGYGISTTNGVTTLVKCDSTLNCLTCNSNSASCESCPTNYGLFLNTATSIKSCIYSKEDDQINTGKGKDTAASTDTTLILVACDPTLNCLTCLPDSKSCTSCDYTANRYLYTTVSTGKKSCLTPGGGKGKSYDTTSGQITLKDCDSTKHCLTCDADYSKCSTCDTSATATYKWLRSSDSSCVSTPDLGYTLQSTPDYKMVQCTALRCQTCLPTDLTRCTECLTATSLIRVDDGSCYETSPTWPAALAGYGRDTAATPNTIVKCDSTLNCLACTASYKSCESCATNYGLYTSASTGVKSCVYAKEDDAVNTGKGKDTTVTSSVVLRDCDPSKNCQACLSDYSSCSTCDASKNLYLYTDSSTSMSSCLSPGSGKGKYTDPTTGLITLRDCDSTKHCLTCDADYSKCSTCDTSASATYKWLRSSDSSCVSTPDLGYTLQSTPDYKMVQCTALRCKTCLPTDLTRCTECLTATSLIRVDDGSCYETSPTWPAALAGYGRDTAATPNTIVKCDSTLNCLACTASYKSCESCATNYGLYTSASTGVKSCVYAKEDDAVNTGKGKDTTVTSSVVLKDCDSTKQCLTCLNDFTSCSSCDSSLGLYLYQDSSTLKYSCITASNGKGKTPNPITGLITLRDCDSTKHCLTCDADYSKCTTCDTSASATYKWLRSSDSSCVSTPDLGYTLQSTPDYKMVQCTALRCKTCLPTDLTRCTECLTATSLIRVDDGSCYETSPTWPAALAGYGRDTAVTPNTIVKCRSSLSCGSCTANYQICETCPSNYGLYSYPNTANNICIISNYDDVSNKGKGKDTSITASVVIKDCSPTLSCQTCLPNYLACSTCDTANNFFLYGASCKKWPTQGLGKYRDPITGIISLKDCAAEKNCLTCDNDYTQCMSCTLPRMLYTSGSTSTCIDTTSDTTENKGKGIDSSVSPTVLRDCDSLSNCQTCLSNYLRCATCKTGYNLYQTTSKCLARQTDTIENKGKGLDAGDSDNSKFLDCSSGLNCQTCRLNYKSCSSCDNANGMYMYTNTITSISSCIYAGSETPDNKPYGLAMDSKGMMYLLPCDSSKSCATCLQSYTKCTTCNVGMYLNSWTDSCQFSPVGSSDTCPVTCKADGCLTCSTDFSKCLTCGTATSYVKTDDGNCYETSNSAIWSNNLAGYGLKNDVSPKTIEKCAAGLNCGTCGTNYLSCDDCMVDYGLYTNTNGISSCIYSKEDDQVNKGKGKDTSQTSKVVLKDCSLGTQCLTCLEDYTKCSSCNNNGGYFLYVSTNSDNGKCMQITPGKGKSIDTTVGTVRIRDCDASKHCLTCDNDYTKCMTCDTNGAYKYLQTSDSSCQSTVPSGSTTDLNGNIVSCAATNCDTCDSSNIYRCTKCKTITNLYLKTDDGTCRTVDPAQQWPSVLAGYGLDSSTIPNTIAKCSPTLNCATCDFNILTCTTCPTDYGRLTVTVGSTSTFRCVYIKEDDAANKGYGKDTVASTPSLTILTTCRSDINCLTCLTDYSKCSSCDASSGRYLYNTDGNGRCLVPGGLYGKYRDPTTGVITLRDCLPEKHCGSCEDDYTKCKTCSVQYPYLNSVDSSCVASLPQGTAADSSKTFYPCNPSCATCDSSNLNRCLTCLTATSFIKTDTGLCVETNPWNSATLDGYGKKTTGSVITLEKCDTTLGCLTCNNDYLSCLTCPTGYTLYLNPTTQKNSCIYSKEDDSVNKGKGITTSTTPATLVACDPTKKCLTCLQNYQVCTSCDSSSGLYLFTDGSCQPIVAGKGKSTDTVTGAITLKNCINNCLTCEKDYTQCTSCDNSRGLFLYRTDLGVTQCIDASAPSAGNAGKGKDLSASPVILRNCDPIALCDTCLPDYQKCVTCIGGYELDDSNNRCKPMNTNSSAPICLNAFTPSATPGTGIDPLTGKLKSCSSTSNCLTCEDNINKCTSCNEGYSLIDNVCQANFNQKAMNTDGETTLVFSQDLSKVSLDNLEYRVTDYTDENKVTVCPPSDCKVERDSDNPKALKFTLKPEFEVLRGIVSVVRKKTTSRVLEIGGDGNNRVLQSASTSTQPDPFANPVIIKETQFSMFSALGKISAYTGLFTTVNIIRVLSLYILAGLSSPRAYFGTDILSTLFYFSIIEGPLVAYTERFLEDHIHWRLLVIDFGNPFGDWNKYCYAGSSYPKNHLYCNYLTNYGQNSIILLITFILCLIFYIASRFIRKSEEASLDTLSINRFDIRPKLRRAFTDLGLVFFINLMDALKLPIFVFSLIQFKQTSKGGEMSTGMSVAVIASAYYLYSLYMMIVMSDDTWKATQNRENRTDYENKNLTAGIDIDRMDYNLFKLGVMGMKWPTAGWQFMGPLVSFIRALIIAVILVFFTLNVKAAILAILFTELAQFFFRMTLCRHKISILHSTMDVVYSSLIVIYLFLKFLTMIDIMAENSRQRVLGALLTIILFLLWILLVLDVVLEFIRIAFDMKRACLEDYSVSIPKAYRITHPDDRNSRTTKNNIETTEAGVKKERLNHLQIVHKDGQEFPLNPMIYENAELAEKAAELHAKPLN
jgi:hypothetical protein